MTTLAFTIDNLNALKPPQKGTTRYQDRQNPALSLYITSKGVLTFFVRKRIKGRDHRFRIGRFPTVTVAQARTQATMIAARIEMGHDPIDEKRKEEEKNQTLETLCAIYIERYAKQRNKQWQLREKEIGLYLKPLLKKRLVDISRNDVERLQSQIGQRAPIQANRVMALLRGIFNYAIKRGWDGKNPAQGFERYKEKSRDRFIQPNEMPFLLAALDQEQSPLMRDYFRILLMTGCRKTNVQQMRWEQIDFYQNTWRIPDTKNGQPVTVPLIEQAMDILKCRKESSKSPWVFPQNGNPLQPLHSPQKAWNRIRAAATILLWRRDQSLCAFIDEIILKASTDVISSEKFVQKTTMAAKQANIYLPIGLMDVRIHDLRRTFGSYQAMHGASLQVIGKSLGHKSLAATQIYARMNLDPVRASVEKGVGAMLNL